MASDCNAISDPGIGRAREAVFTELRSRADLQQPKVGLILGTGMGFVSSEIEDPVAIPYGEIPGLQISTVAGHSGCLLFGKMGSTPVVAMNGRSHYYEGYSTAQICFPVQLLHSLGVQSIFIGNAAGGINPGFRSGQVMIIEDHLDLMFKGNNTIGFQQEPRLEHTGRLQSIGKPYSNRLIQRTFEIAKRCDIQLEKGVYAALTGPNYETRSEYRMLGRLGADAVGMSTIPEANTAAKLGIEVCGLSTITNIVKPERILKTSHEEVVAAVESAGKILKTLLGELVNL